MEHPHLSLKAEYGSWQYELYWGCHVDYEKRELRVSGQEVEGGERCFPLTEDQARAFFRDADKFKVISCLLRTRFFLFS